MNGESGKSVVGRQLNHTWLFQLKNILWNNQDAYEHSRPAHSTREWRKNRCMHMTACLLAWKGATRALENWNQLASLIKKHDIIKHKIGGLHAAPLKIKLTVELLRSCQFTGYMVPAHSCTHAFRVCWLWRWRWVFFMWQAESKLVNTDSENCNTPGCKCPQLCVETCYQVFFIAIKFSSKRI